MLLMKGHKSKIVDSIKLKVSAKMEDVTVKLENDVREITALEVSLLSRLELRGKDYHKIKK